MSQPVSQISPPGKPVRIAQKPNRIEIANAASAGTPNDPSATTNAISRTPQPASDTGSSWIKGHRWHDHRPDAEWKPVADTVPDELESDDGDCDR
jgi:hypothetical protein